MSGICCVISDTYKFMIKIPINGDDDAESNINLNIRMDDVSVADCRVMSGRAHQ